MVERQAGTGAEVVMPVSDLHGRTVWSDGGQRIGTIREINTDDEGRIISFDVRERWFFGAHHEVPAADMRLDGGDVVVPMSAIRTMHTREARMRDVRGRDDDAVETPTRSTSPVLLAGREGVRARFGGLDLLGSLFGALVTIASMVLIGGVLGAIFGSDPANVDTSFGALDDLLDEALLVGAATLFVSSFLGGWCAGRSARYDGIGNGLMSVVWVLAIAVGIGALASWIGDQYDVLVNANLPTFTNDEFALWGIVGLAVALGLMLLGAALGGALGESWHRRADRAMLDVVPLGARVGRVDDDDAVVADTTVMSRRDEFDDTAMVSRRDDVEVVETGEVEDAPRVVNEPAPRIRDLDE
jgi:hypothetical protein